MADNVNCKHYIRILTFFETWPPGRFPSLSCRCRDPWPWRPGVCVPSASPCARRRIRGSSCVGRRSCRWTCDGLGGRAPIRICYFETLTSGTWPAVNATADERYRTGEPITDGLRPLCPKRYKNPMLSLENQYITIYIIT